MIIGGAQENTLSTAAGLAALTEYQVVLFTGSETGSEGNLLKDRDNGVEVLLVPHLVRAIRPHADILALGCLYRQFVRRRPDIVHTHSSKAGVLGRISARAAGVPVVVHTLHSLVFHDYQHPALNTACRTIKRALVPFTDHYVSVSDNIGRRAIAAGIGQPHQHSTIRSGFDTREFVSLLKPRAEARAHLGLPLASVIVGTVARLFPLKGHAEILRAARRVIAEQPDVLFVFVGGGPLRNDLERQVARSGMGRHVRFLGRVAPQEMATVFSSFDILVHASLREGLARVIPQGLLAGLPVVCYDLDGSSEVVTDGVNGFLVPARDTNVLAQRLALLIRDGALRSRLAGEGRQRIAKDFAVQTMVSEIDLLYKRLLAEQAARPATG